MFYNLLNYTSNTESQNRTPHLKTILDNVQPDLFMVCELKNSSGSDYLFNNAILPFNNHFNKATFEYAQSGGSLQQMVYYNNDKLVLEASNIITTRVRDINHYTFKINTENAETNPIKIEVFVTHLKASYDSSNRQKRLESVEEFTRELERIPANSYVLFAGDFNFYTSNEEGFLKIIDPTNFIKITDPINRLCPTFPNDGNVYYNTEYDNTYFWNNASFKDIHTQSTRTSAGSDGAGGGMDDRFDFIMMSENFNSSSDLFYVNNSYKSIGNNGNCYNSYVSNVNCSGVFSQSLRAAIYNFSDHLPVVMEIETPKNTLSTYNYLNPITFTSSNIIETTLSFSIPKNSDIYNIIVYNQLGQKLQEIETKNKTEFKLNISHFSKGIYYLKAENYSPKKIIKI
ncbi:T9SS type A sorting domain-containing protein [Polaribacter sp. MSW13]|uniref:T9SS type A sorting domain-containing protein n=1 Tax=Polaribacter marinus TaxID=2916838 RepID=A0A9X1VLA5_9FLAO|nr:T9SS type A sorting domain-containing protein [Polaribacter marinus]MCI2227663.1 T9SS type A sorting domain-containing protein [Polaribacter marinus]